jgi:hypothetical protein
MGQMMARHLVVGVVLMATLTGRAYAEGYLSGGIHFPKQDAAPRPTSPYPVAPSGRTTGWTAGGGVYLNSAMAIDVAWARTGVMGSVQTPRSRNTFAFDLRDNFVSVGARGRIRAASHLTIEPAAGFVVLVREHWSQQQGGYPRVKGAEEGYGLSVGVDARIGSQRIGLVPTFRVYLTNGDVSARVYSGGAEHVTIAPGLGMQMNF